MDYKKITNLPHTTCKYNDYPTIWYAAKVTPLTGNFPEQLAIIIRSSFNVFAI